MALKTFTQASALIAASMYAASLAAQQAWPVQPISMILPAGTGGTSDPLARLLATQMGQLLGQSIVVQNRPGAGGNIGMAQAARAKPDGYTIVLSWTGPLATNLALYDDVGYDPRRDFSPVGFVGCTPNVLAVRADFSGSDLNAFAQYAIARKQGTNYGTTGVGSSWHLTAEMLNQHVGRGLVHVPYQSPGATLTDLLGGRLEAIFPLVPMVVGPVQAGQIKVLAVFSDERSPVLPDIPTTVEQGWPDLISETCFALLAPAKTPELILQKLNESLNAVLQDPKASAQLASMGVQLRRGEPEALGHYLEVEIPKQAELVKAAGASAQ